MIKVFESFDFSRVGQMQSLLEAHGIRTFIRNQYGCSVMGEIPFVEVCPQLYVLQEGDLGAARRLLQVDAPLPATDSGWRCAECGMEVEGQFSHCWNCGSPAPA